MRCALAVVVLACSAGATRAAADEQVEATRARQLADTLGLTAKLELIQQTPAPTTVEETVAHVHAVEHAIVDLSRAELTLDATRARLQHEEFEAKNAHDLVSARHEHTITNWNLAAVLVGNGVAVVGAGLEMGNDTTAKWGNGVVIAGSALAAAFSIVALIKRDAGPLPLAIDTNLLAPFFDCVPTPASRYPDWIWRYLDIPLAGASGSIRRELLDKWTREGRIPRGDTASVARRTQLLCEPLRGARRVDADVIDDRADMLADVRERLAEVSVDLELLWRDVHARH
jgi:hypothetical protein